MILTDIRMPDLDGRALYEEIVRRWPRQAGRVVFVTGDTLASALRDFVAESGRPVIEKPFLPSEVRRVVAELATERRNLKQTKPTPGAPGEIPLPRRLAKECSYASGYFTPRGSELQYSDLRDEELPTSRRCP